MIKLFFLFFIIISTSIASAEDKLQIITSFSILQDITKNITKDKANVLTIVPVGSDAHSYNLTPKDLINIEKSDIFIISGLGFEGFLTRLKNNSHIAPKLIEASLGISPLDMNIEEIHDNHNHKDPHVWQNPLNVLTYVDNVVKVLCDKDLENCNFYKNNSELYKNELLKIDQKFSTIFKNIPNNNRVMITTHDAFQYLAKRYNIRIYAPLGIDNNSEPSAKDLAKFNALLKKSKINSIFIENITNNSLIKQLSESNDKIINGELYSDALAKDGECSTYLGLINHNLTSISQAMNSK